MHDIRWVINLGNSICGVALLVLPYCFSQCGILLGAVLLLFSAVLTTWSCHLLLENVFACKVASYEGIAKELYGKHGKLLVEISATTLNIGCCSAFFVIISDLSPGVISFITGSSSIDPNLHLVILTSLGLTIILPLSMIRNLEPLNYVSLASLTFYISLTVQLSVWAIKNGSEGGVASNLKLFDYTGIFRVLPIYALGFSCHLQLMAMTREVVGDVKDGMVEELTRMKWISKGAVTIVATLYGSVSLFGHIAFCDNGVEADVLSNFNHGPVAQFTRFGFALSVLLSFPFMVNPCRAALYSLIYKRTDKMIPIQKHFILTFSIVFTAFFIAVTTPNVAVVVALTGAISGAIICYLFPAVSFLYNSKINHKSSQRIRAWILICVGVVLLTLGTMSALSSSSTSHEKVGVVTDTKTPHSNLVEDKDGGGVNPAGLMDLLKTDTNMLNNKKINDNDNEQGGGVDQVPLPDIVKVSDNPILPVVGETLTGVDRALQEDKGGKNEEEERKRGEETEKKIIDKKDGGQEQEENEKQKQEEDEATKEHLDHIESTIEEKQHPIEDKQDQQTNVDTNQQPINTSKEPLQEDKERKGGNEDLMKRDTNTDTAADPHTNIDAAADPHTNTDANPHTDTAANPHTNSDTAANPHADTAANPHTNDKDDTITSVKQLPLDPPPQQESEQPSAKEQQTEETSVDVVDKDQSRQDTVSVHLPDEGKLESDSDGETEKFKREIVKIGDTQSANDTRNKL